MQPYRNLAGHWRERLGAKAWKAPLDAGLGCPNRDGTISRAGCVFCNPRGSGTGLAAKGLSLAAQWERQTPARPGTLRIAYLQSYTNTHCAPGRLAGLLDELAALPDIAGACIGTRPDCLEPEKLDLLARFARRLALAAPEAGVQPEVWLDLGLQSCDDATLTCIGRGHDAACFAHAARRASEAGLKVCAHVMFGLPTGPGVTARASDRTRFSDIQGKDPGCPAMRCPDLGLEAGEAATAGEKTGMATEGAEALWRTVEFVNALPVAGIKFHNTMVVRGARLEGWWREGRYVPPCMDDYATAVALALARLRPDVVVHRLAADPAQDELLAPSWATDKHAVLARIRKIMAAQGLRQGSLWKG